VTVHVDTSALIDALTGPRRSLDTLIHLTQEGHRLAISTIVLYEWLRGPRTPADLDAQAALFPVESAVEFGPAEAARAAQLYQQVKKPRGREIDLAIAAIALEQGAAILTLNPEDFRDVPALQVI
jgi:predicted nucleic acid-binding protein